MHPPITTTESEHQNAHCHRCSWADTGDEADRAAHLHTKATGHPTTSRAVFSAHRSLTPPPPKED